MKYIVFITSILISGQVLAENTSQWGSWGQPPAQFRQQMESSPLNEGENLYGSGIAGTDEKLLHELDQSSLLDYQRPVSEHYDYTASLTLSTSGVDESLDFSDTRVEVNFSTSDSFLNIDNLVGLTESELPNELLEALDAVGIAPEDIKSISVETLKPEAPAVELDMEVEGQKTLHTSVPSVQTTAE